MTSINNGAFSRCSGLTSITVDAQNPVYHSAGNCIIETESKTLIAGYQNSAIPDDGSVISIGFGAFYGCSGLTSITIPDSVTSIGEWAFAYCSGLTNITFNGTMEQWNSISKVDNWNSGTGDYTIYCTNGDINK